MPEELNEVSEAEKGFAAPDTFESASSGATNTELGNGNEQNLMESHAEWLQGVVEKSTGPAKVVARKVAAQEPTPGKMMEFLQTVNMPAGKALDGAKGFSQV